MVTDEVQVKLFPRLSIDSARRVRQLAHVANGQICSNCGRRVAKHMARIAGPWLAGCHENDRAAAKAAIDALNLVFPSSEKIEGVRKTFLQATLEYCRDAILHETASTLSDARSVSREDAEATHSRVVSSCLALISSLLHDLERAEVEKHTVTYEELFTDRLFEYALDSDPFVRRSTHKLVRISTAKVPDMIRNNVRIVSKVYVYTGLASDQTGSSVDYISTLGVLTAEFPNIWTAEYPGKKSAASRLCRFLKHGSQGASPDFWPFLAHMIGNLPQAVLPRSEDEIADMLSAARDGVSRKDERLNSSGAWQAYIVLVNTLSKLLDEDAQDRMLRASVLPLVMQFISPSQETADWSITNPRAAWLVSRSLQIRQFTAMLQCELPLQVERIISEMEALPPEQTTDYGKSQEQMAVNGQRWSLLHKEMFKSDVKVPETFTAILISTNVELLRAALSIVVNSEGKSYGAAALADELLRACGEFLTADPGFKPLLMEFVERDLPLQLFKPSQRFAMSCLFALSNEASFSARLNQILGSVIGADVPATTKMECLRDVFGSRSPEAAASTARDHHGIQGLFLELCTPSWPEGNIAQPGSLADLLSLHIVSPATSRTCLTLLTEALENENAAPDALRALNSLYLSNGEILIAFVSDSASTGAHLLPHLLQLEQVPDDKIAELANSLSSRLSVAPAGTADSNHFSIVRRALESVSKTSLSVDSLCDLATRLIRPEENTGRILEMLPDFRIWDSTLKAMLPPPSPALAVLSPFGGAVALVETQAQGSELESRYDSDGFSQPLRIAMLVARLLATTDLPTQLVGGSPPPGRSPLVTLLLMTVLVAQDNIRISGSNQLWIPASGVEAEVLAFISEANAGVAALNSRAFDHRISLSTLDAHLHSGYSPPAYYSALTNAQILSYVVGAHGATASLRSEIEDALLMKRKDENLFALLMHIVGYQRALAESPTMTRICNKLVADLTGLDPESEMQKALHSLITFNALLRFQEGLASSVAKQRMIFFTKRVLLWTKPEHPVVLRQESLTALNGVLPEIKDVYGEHWRQTMDAVLGIWTNATTQAPAEDQIPLIHSSLKLYGTLRKLSTLEVANEDLLDAYKEQEEQLRNALLQMVQAAAGVSDEANQPLMITYELLCRQIRQLPPTPLSHEAEYYALLYTPSRAIHEAAFHLLRNQIRSTREKVSFDAALDRKTAQLPEELLSLILEPPTLQSLADASFDRFMPLSLEGYLYSWLLLFDHFDSSSYQVKNDYIEQLKDGLYLSGLLSFTFDFLGHTHGKPVDASRLDLAHYQSQMEPSPERDVQWLLCHLYYRAMTLMPTVVKSYVLEIRSRQTPALIESWTAKFVSPLIIAASLEAVSAWSEKTVNEHPEYEKMSVKVGMRSKEIHASYLIDEQTMAIKVVLPDAYPLVSAHVTGVSRVAVREEKWQSWLRNCQGVINFSVSCRAVSCRCD